MALSDNAKKALNIALGSKEQNSVGKEVAAAIDASGSGPAAAVAALGALAAIPAANSVLSTSNTYTDAAVKTAINGAVDSASGSIKTELDALQAKIDLVIANLKAAGLMSS